jgi:2-polyprenyl-3-methyl-5-hydroxy-6-metoxy-1,4-benzoquinol methylase
MQVSNHNSESSGYDDVPYPGHAYPETHPDLMATIAILSGMTPPVVRSCRVLEIGCGDGSNLIPMATSLPHATFVGIDLALKPINRAQSIIDRTSMTNINVRVMDLQDVTSDFGQFDYIIAHGFYSWVPASLQDKLLSVCGDLLYSRA